MGPVPRPQFPASRRLTGSALLHVARFVLQAGELLRVMKTTAAFLCSTGIPCSPAEADEAPRPSLFLLEPTSSLLHDVVPASMKAGDVVLAPQIVRKDRQAPACPRRPTTSSPLPGFAFLKSPLLPAAGGRRPRSLARSLRLIPAHPQLTHDVIEGRQAPCLPQGQRAPLCSPELHEAKGVPRPSSAPHEAGEAPARPRRPTASPAPQLVWRADVLQLHVHSIHEAGGCLCSPTKPTGSRVSSAPRPSSAPPTSAWTTSSPALPPRPVSSAKASSSSSRRLQLVHNVHDGRRAPQLVVSPVRWHPRRLWPIGHLFSLPG